MLIMDLSGGAVISALFLCMIPSAFSSTLASECQSMLIFAREASTGEFFQNFEKIMSCALLEQQRASARQARGNLPFQFPDKRCNFPCSTTFKDVFLVQIPACASYDIQCCVCIVGTTFKTIFPEGSGILSTYYQQFQVQLNEIIASFFSNV
ncbi:unnamed protein product [Notodromas monacha]|uniref:Uncharacterized protein n=1 Tax=Notodromas monacha TaxID=399045 RepID=A0A7R9BEB0_9CRUS|nr:unnamed protein product [Notodromas monacha]CAG0913755.1 unnamed protein product [Notodromas monacha]